MFMGWLTWGMCIYWITGEALGVGVSGILGAIVSYIISKRVRNVGVAVFLLPLILTAVFGS